MYQDASAIGTLQFVDSSFEVCVGLEDRSRGARLGGTSGQTFYLADRHAGARDSAGKFEARVAIGDREQSAAMTSSEAAFFEQVLNRLLEFQEADGIRDRGAVFSRAVGDLFLGEIEFFAQTLECVRLLDRIQILALEVFD